MSTEFENNLARIKGQFGNCTDQENIYTKIIELGRQVALLDPTLRTPDRLVAGCQSTLYLSCLEENGKLFFSVYSDALISCGLAALLIEAYKGVAAEEVLTLPPDFLEELNIPASLTPSRANGLYQIHLKMKQEALKLLAADTRCEFGRPEVRSHHKAHNRG